MNENLVSTLGNHQFLKGLTTEQVTALAECARPIAAAAGTYLFHEGDPAEACYLLQTGRVAIEIHAPRGAVTVQTIAPGEIVGWSWLIPPFVWQFDARAVDGIQALVLDGPTLRSKLAEDHELGFQFLQRMIAVVSSRLTSTRLQLLDVFK